MNKFIISFVCFVFAFMLQGKDVLAHHPAGGGGLGQATPAITASAHTLKENAWSVELRGEYIELKTLSDERLTQLAQEGKDAHSVNLLMHFIAGIAYGVYDDVTVALRAPYEYLMDIRANNPASPSTVDALGDSNGLGDISLTGYYRFLRLKDKGLEASAMIGLKAPTGRTNARDSNGEIFESDHQPGSGSWDQIAGLALSKRLKSFSVDSSALYTIVNKGSQDTDLGDIFYYNISLSWRALRPIILWDLFLELNGESRQHTRKNGREDENSGGSVLYLSPGMRFSLKDSYSTFMSLGFPIAQRHGGIQNEISSRFVIGVNINF